MQQSAIFCTFALVACYSMYLNPQRTLVPKVFARSLSKKDLGFKVTVLQKDLVSCGSWRWFLKGPSQLHHSSMVVPQGHSHKEWQLHVIPVHSSHGNDTVTLFKYQRARQGIRHHEMAISESLKRPHVRGAKVCFHWHAMVGCQNLALQNACKYHSNGPQWHWQDWAVLSSAASIIVMAHGNGTQSHHCSPNHQDYSTVTNNHVLPPPSLVLYWSSH